MGSLAGTGAVDRAAGTTPGYLKRAKQNENNKKKNRGGSSESFGMASICLNAGTVCVGLISLLPKAILNGPYLLSIKISTLLKAIQDSKVYRYLLGYVMQFYD